MRQDQRGTSLLELLVASAITALVVAGLGSAPIQFIQVARWGGERLTTSHGVQNAILWMGRDIPMAQSTDLLEGTPATSLTLSWTDRYGNGSVSHISSYAVAGGELQRNYDGQLTTVARDVSNVEFSRTGKTITVTVTTTQGRTSQQGSVSFNMRPNG